MTSGISNISISASYSSYTASSSTKTTTETADESSTSSAVTTTTDDASDSSASSGYSDLLDSMGVDEGDATDSGSYSMQYASLQYTLNYSVVKSLAAANGITLNNVNLSVNATLSLYQSSTGSSATNSSSSLTDQLQELFSPENTAQRILDFALSFYASSDSYSAEGDTAAARAEFADTIGAAIQKGFDLAQSILGNLPDDVQSIIDQTHQLVFDGLADFVENGLDTGDDGETSAIYQQLQYSLSVNYSYSSTYASDGTVGAAADTAGLVDAEA